MLRVCIGIKTLERGVGWQAGLHTKVLPTADNCGVAVCRQHPGVDRLQLWTGSKNAHDDWWLTRTVVRSQNEAHRVEEQLAAAAALNDSTRLSAGGLWHAAQLAPFPSPHNCLTQYRTGRSNIFANMTYHVPVEMRP